MKRIRLSMATPYVGLRPYTEAEALLFFGRDQHVRELLARLGRRQRFLAVLGASGSGKSSLVRAGLIPALHRGSLHPVGWAADGTGGGEGADAGGSVSGGAAPSGPAGTAIVRWNVCIFTPGDAPLARLARALTQDPRWLDGLDLVDAQAALTAALGNGPLSLAGLFRRKAAQFAGEALLLVVDQFEEIFRYRQRNPDEADRFVRLLLRAAVEPLPIYVVMTMRSDFLGQAAAVHGLAEAINGGIYLTPRLDADSIRSVVTAPLALVGGAIDPVLATRLLNTLAGDDELPVLQHALLRMWDRARAAGRTTITADDFAAVCAPRDGPGEPALPHAIDNHADELHAALTPAQQAAARAAFAALAERGGGRDVRRPQTLGELQALVPAGLRQAVADVVDAYRASGAGFLLPPGAQPLAPGDMVDISHESLIRRWRRYQAWMGDEALDIAELREWLQRAQRQAEGGGWLDGNDGRRAQAWRSRVQARVVPAAWAARWCGEGSYERVDAYIQGSLAELERLQAEADRLRREAEQAHLQRLEVEAQRQREAAERAEVDRQRAEQDKAQALALAAANRRRGRIAVAGAVGALLLAIGAGFYWWQAQQARERAEAGELASAAQTEGSTNPDLGVLLALEAHRIAPVPRVLGLLRAAEAQYRYRRVLRGHEDRVTSAQFSADGRAVLTTSVDGKARLWNLEVGGEGRLLPTAHVRTISGAEFSRDGRTVLTWGEDGTAQIVDTSGARPAQVLRGHAAPVTSAEFSADGQAVLTASDDGTVRLWKPAGTGPPRQLDVRLCPVHGARFVGDGSRVLVAGGDGRVRLWALDRDEPSHLLQAGAGRTALAGVSADRRQALTIAQDGSATVWDLPDGQAPRLVATLKAEGRIAGARFSADGRRVVTTSDDRHTRLWDAATGEEQRRLGEHEAPLTNARFSPDGRLVASTDAAGTARLWDADTGHELRVLRGHGNVINDAVFSPDGQRLVSASWDRTARLWDTGVPAPVVLRGHDGMAWSVAWSADGRRLLSAGDDRTVRVWDVAGQQTVRLLQGHEGPVRSARWSPDGTRVLTASEDGTLRLWDASSGVETGRREVRGGSVFDAQFDPAGRRVLTASADRQVRLWDLAAGDQAAPTVFTGHEGPVYAVQFSPDGGTGLSGSDDKTVRLHALAGGEAARQLGHHGRPVLAVRYAPDGRTVVTASVDETARLWDTGSRQELRALRGHRGAVRSAVFSADGATVLTAGDDGTARLWDTASGVELRVFRDHAGPVVAAAFAPGGRTIATSGADGTVRLWDCDACLPAGEVVRILTDRIGRSLTDDERRQFGLGGGGGRSDGARRER